VRFAYQRGYKEGLKQGKRDARNRNGGYNNGGYNNGGYNNNGVYSDNGSYGMATETVGATV